MDVIFPLVVEGGESWWVLITDDFIMALLCFATVGCEMKWNGVDPA